MGKKTKFIKWLYSEMPTLVSDGVISEDEAKKLKAHYGDVNEINAGALTLSILSVIGGVLTIGGIILLLAHNWPDMSREIRAVVSFVPLIISFILAGYVILKKKESSAWREGVAVFWIGSVLMCMSLICQTYNMGGDFYLFWFICVILSLPVMYLLDSAVACIICLAWIVFGYSGWRSETPVYFWGLLAAVIPYIWYSFCKFKKSQRNVYLAVGITIAMIFISGLTSDSVRGLWMVSFGALFSVFYFLSVLVDKEKFPVQVFKYTGMIGILYLSAILSCKFAWFDYSSDRIFSENRDFLVEHIYTWILMFLALLFIFKTLIKKKYEDAAWGLACVLAFIGYFTMSMNNISYVPFTISFNAFIAGLGILMLVRGFNLKNVPRMNWGMMIIALLILMRFFDSNIDFIVKGIVFIIIGISILIFNIFLAKKIKSDWKGAGNVN